MKKEKNSEKNNVTTICADCAKDLAKYVRKNMKDNKVVVKKGDFVKFKFSQDKLAENMWIEVTEIGHKLIKGTLNNIPALLTNIKLNDPVICKRKDIQAYISKDTKIAINPIAKMAGMEVVG